MSGPAGPPDVGVERAREAAAAALAGELAARPIVAPDQGASAVAASSASYSFV